MDERNSFQYIIGQQKVPCVCKTDAIFEAVKLSTFSPGNLAKIFSREVVKFRIGKRNTSEVQWEGLCDIREVSISDILIWNEIKDCNTSNEVERRIQSTLGACCNEHYWCYADYMYMKDLFQNHPEILPLLDWNSLGFQGKDGGDSTMWVGTKGAHTLCHYDTYGYNIVVQISGRKRWVLFPPVDSDCLYPTRIPYEESSVFSEVNVKNPDLKKHPKFSSANACVVILNPGEMLYVPHHWWHYVENLELSVSINLWYEMENDADSRLKESITRLLIGSFSHVSTSSDFPWINPNEDPLSVKSVDNGLRYLRQSLEEVSDLRTNCEINGVNTNNDSPLNTVDTEISITFANRENPISIKPLVPSNVKTGLLAHQNHSDQSTKTPVKKMKVLSMINLRRKTTSLDNLTYTEFVKCLTHPDVINTMSQVLQKQFDDTSSFNKSVNDTQKQIMSPQSLPTTDLNEFSPNEDQVVVEIHERDDIAEQSTSNDENAENIECTIIRGASRRRIDKLYDGEGYSYSPRKGLKRTYWRCIIRAYGRQSCQAAVIEENGKFRRNARSHTHPPKQGEASHTRLMKETRLFAFQNPTMTPREIATIKLEEAKSFYPADLLPTMAAMMSHIARYRRRHSLPNPTKKRKKRKSSSD